MTDIKASRPNVIFILADDMGYGDLGRFNGGISQTPVLDELFREGLCLTQHYSASPVCNPARAALLTGRYPHRTGSIDTFEFSYGPPPPAELYNLRDDPAEQHDLASREPQRAADMLRSLQEWFEEVEASRRRHPDAVFK